ncbi:MAG: DNRLRE domain-containing protein [Caldilineae bacterium]|nr:MAG: DNRLRE domain-containing protein [Caldilineae bacterium]
MEVVMRNRWFSSALGLLVLALTVWLGGRADSLATTAVAGNPLQQQGRIAYLFAEDELAATNFGELLQSEGWDVDVFALTQLKGVDLSRYDVIILGADTGNRADWGNPEAQAAVMNARRPVLGIEQGGYSFFGKLKLNMGYPNGATGGTNTSFFPVDPKHQIWHTPYDIPPGSDGSVLVYEKPQTLVAIHDSRTDTSNLLLAKNGGHSEFNLLLGEARCYLQWGLHGDPSAMTSEGRRLFVNTVTFLREWGDCRGTQATATPTPTPTQSPACIGTHTVFATQDTFTDSGQPMAVHGSETILALGRNPNAFRRVLLYFPVEEFIPPGTPIYSARLEMNAADTAGDNPPWNISLFNLRELFSETSTNWTNQPEPFVFYGTTAQSATTGIHSWDATAMVKDWLGGRYENKGVVLTTADRPSNFALYYTSREGKNPPRLIIDCGRQPPTPTPTLTPTATQVPTNTPTPGATPTPTPPVFTAPYLPVYVEPYFLYPISDLSIHGIEITQGIQCFNTARGLASCPDNSLPVVTKKSTTARIYLKVSGLFSAMNNVPVRLYIRANGVWYQANATGKATTSVDQTKKDSADVYFVVNFSNDVPVDFYAVVDPNDTISETNEGNNRYPASGYITLNFRKRDNLKIVGQRIRYHPGGYTGDQWPGGWAVNGGAADWFEQLLPISNNGINYSLKSGYLNWTTSLGSSDGQHALIATLNALWILDNAMTWLLTGSFTGANHVYGWAPNDGYSGGHADMPVYPHAGGLGVVGIGTDRPGTSTDDPGGGALIFGHELVHDYNVYHTDTADSCGSNDNNSDFPYASSSIQEVGFNTRTGKIYDPADTHDLMSYCPASGTKEGWISPFTWNKMFNKFVPSQIVRATDLETLQPNTFYATDSEQSLVVNATIFNPDVSREGGVLGSLYLIDTGMAVLPEPGDYAIQLRKGSEILTERTFVVNFESEYDAHGGTHPEGQSEPPFPPDPTAQIDVSFIMPWEPGADTVALVHKGQVLDTRPVSATAPFVRILEPAGATTWPAGSIQSLKWEATDIDGDPLSYSVLFSNDGGASWTLVASELSEPSYDAVVDTLAGGSQGMFRVVANDGVNIGWDDTDGPITIPNKKPQVLITHPATDYQTTPGALVVLEGTATDLEDGGLPDEAMLWTSNLQGNLGIGPSVSLNTLSMGTHTITLTARDSAGQESQASVRVVVAHETYLPSMLH